MDSPKPRAYNVNDVEKWDRDGELVLQPRFQRRYVWSKKARSYLIDTILRNFPVPIIFIRQQVDMKTRSTTREVVDGQQRLRAILDFLHDKFTVLKSHNPQYGGKKFSELPEEVQRNFLGYEFSVVILSGTDDGSVLDVFARLNTYTETLTPQELLNAQFFGEFKSVVYELGRDHLEFWRRHRILSARQILRMAESELVSELVVAMIDGLQDKKKSLIKFYKEFDDEFPHAKKVRHEFKTTLNKIAEILDENLGYLPFHRRALFYSLFCVFYDAIYVLPNSPTNTKKRKYNIPAHAKEDIVAALTELGTKIELEKSPPDFASFVDACSRQTDNIRPRQTRHTFIWRAISPYFESR